MFIPCTDCPVRRSRAFRPFSDAELRAVAAAKEDQLDFPARAEIVQAGGSRHLMFTILSGWAFRYKRLGPGSRQILDFLLPGDPIALHSPFTGNIEHNVAAVTRLTVCQIAGDPLLSMFEAHPDLAAAMMRTLLLNEDRSDRRLLLLGRQRPTQRLAYLMLEVRDRQIMRDLAESDRCPFPLTYGHMADALGLSRAQLARSLAELRDRAWAELEGGELRLIQSEAMADFCSYDPSFATAPRALI